MQERMARDPATGSNPLIESDRVEGTEVYGADQRGVGSIKRLMIDKKSGQVAYAVLGFGGFLGLGEETYTIPWGKLSYDVDLGGYRTDLTADQIQGAPDFYRGDDYGWRERDKERELHTYYGVTPYWGI
nr:PRC-barrel domain-containing protein [Enterovirga rhinocerotis]